MKPWEQQRAQRAQKKQQNTTSALAKLRSSNVEFEEVDGHYKIGEYDFWPESGVFVHRGAKTKGKGVDELINLVK